MDRRFYFIPNRGKNTTPQTFEQRVRVFTPERVEGLSVTCTRVRQGGYTNLTIKVNNYTPFECWHIDGDDRWYAFVAQLTFEWRWDSYMDPAIPSQWFKINPSDTFSVRWVQKYSRITNSALPSQVGVSLSHPYGFYFYALEVKNDNDDNMPVFPLCQFSQRQVVGPDA